MKIDLKQFTGPCGCGQAHGMAIKRILLEPGAIDRLPAVVAELGLAGPAFVISDSNTWKAAGQRVDALLDGAAVVLGRGDIHPDEQTVEQIEAAYPADTGYIVGVGGGVLTDTAKYIGHQHGGVPVVLVPTAPSVDGYAANSSVMTFNHFKHPLTTQAAVAIVADTDVLAAAPERLIASGLGDLLGKYVALADWDFAHLITGEKRCQRLYDMVNEAVGRAVDAAADIKARQPEAIEALMYALILAGLTIQMWGNSRPASGAEHQIGHVWELAVVSPEADLLHGEAVGVGTLAAKRLYERLFEVIGDRPQDFIRDYKGFPHEELKGMLGEVVYKELMPYNTPDENTLVSREKLVDNWEEIRRIYTAIPSAGQMEALFKSCGMKTSLTDLGLEEAVLAPSLQVGAYVRGRMSLYRAWHGFTDIEMP